MTDLMEPAYLTPGQQAVAIVGAIALFLVVLKLIYDRRLREDYGALWFTVSVATLVLAVWQEGLRYVARLLQALTLTAPIFLLSILFLTLVAIHFSVRMSALSFQLHKLAQRMAILDAAGREREDRSGTDQET